MNAKPDKPYEFCRTLPRPDKLALLRADRAKLKREPLLKDEETPSSIAGIVGAERVIAGIVIVVVNVVEKKIHNSEAI